MPRSLRTRAFAGLTQFVIALAVLIFGAAWTFDYWQGWIFLFAFFTIVTYITFHFLKSDPGLIERRLKAGSAAEKEKSQKIIQAFANLFFLAIIVFPVLDHRFGWSDVTAIESLIGDLLVVVGLLIVFLVFRENSYTSAIIEVGSEQKVITTGPYRLVRHPMYSGALLMLLGVPLAHGSLWGLLFWLPMLVVIVLRLKDEERFLKANLQGYPDYTTQTRFRLIPGIY